MEVSTVMPLVEVTVCLSMDDGDYFVMAGDEGGIDGKGDDGLALG